jgi:hypothetical protein
MSKKREQRPEKHTKEKGNRKIKPARVPEEQVKRVDGGQSVEERVEN